jgi:hypothetical protein
MKTVSSVEVLSMIWRVIGFPHPMLTPGPTCIPFQASSQTLGGIALFILFYFIYLFILAILVLNSRF